MPIDLERIVRAAAEAVLDGQDAQSQQASTKTKRKRLTGPRAMLIGAGVFTAGRMLVRGRGLVDGLQERLSDYESRFLGDDDDEPEDEDFDEEEPEGEYEEDERPEGEYDDEPEGEYDEDEEPEDEYEEPDDEVEDEEPEDEAEFEDEEPEEESEPSRRTSSAAGRHNGRH